MIAKDLQRVFSQKEEIAEILPWWMGLQTIERAQAIQAEIEEQVVSLSTKNREHRRAFARLGFAGHRA